MSFIVPDDEILPRMLHRLFSEEAGGSIKNGQVLEQLPVMFAVIEQASSLVSVINQLFARYQLTQPRFFILAYLNYANEQQVTPALLAEVMGVTRATMTGFLDGLEKKNWIIRSIDPEDRRRVIVKMSEEGDGRWHNLIPQHIQTIMSLAAGLSAAELSQLLGLLNTCVSHMKTVDLTLA